MFVGLSDAVVEHRRGVILVTLLLTAAFTAGAATVEESTSLDDFRTGSAEAEALERVEENFSTRGTDTTTVQVVIEGENVLDRAAFLEILAFQSAIQDDEAIDRTLVDDQPIVGVPNAVATDAYLHARTDELERRADELEAEREAVNETASSLEAALEAAARDPGSDPETEFESVEAASPIPLTDDHYDRFAAAVDELRAARSESAVERAVHNGTVGVLADEYDALAANADALETEREGLTDEAAELTIEDQRDQLSSMNDSEVERGVQRVLGDDGRDEVLALVPSGYDPGSASATATLVVITQETDGEPVGPDTAPPELVETQLAIADEAASVEGLDVSVVGHGITTHEIGAAAGDSLSVVGPVAMLFVLGVLVLVYRDPLDVALGVLGVLLVLVWTVGFMGWAGIDFSIVFVGSVVLLIGLSIDFALHVVMRVREARQADDSDARSATAEGLASVGVALLAVAATTSIGFLSNLVSPIGPLREFGLVSAVGIVAALCLFTGFLPAVKAELDDRLERRGVDRRRRAVGTGDGLEPVLSIGARLARRAPAVLAVALLVTAAGGLGATQVDVSFETEEFLPEEPPEWVETNPVGPDTESYTAAATLDTLDDRFVRQDRRTDVLVEGDPTDPATLQRVERGEARLGAASTVETLPNGEPATRTPLSVLDDVAERNESFAATLEAADTTGDGVPDADLETVYDDLYATDEAAAAAVVSRSESGAYESLRLTWVADGAAPNDAITAEARAVADAIEGDGVAATATGQETVIAYQVERAIVETTVEGLLVTLIAVALVLVVVFRITAGSASLGLVALFPVVLVLAWIAGAMAALDIPLNFITAMITSLTIGLGVDYSLHVTERYQQELSVGRSPAAALRTTVTGTGGALLGSATTTAAGFGVLAFAFLPSLQYFGIIAALSILFAFVASVLVLPSLLAIWTRWVGPGDRRSGEQGAADRRSGGQGTGGRDSGDREATDDRPAVTGTE